MIAEPQIDYEKIWNDSPCLVDEYDETDYVKIVDWCMRKAVSEAIWLAAPLLLDNFDNWDDYFTMPTKQSIIDAVESVTSKILGE